MKDSLFSLFPPLPMLIKPSSSSESLAPRLPVGQCRSQDEALQGEKLISEGEGKLPCRSLPPVTKVPAGTSAGRPHHPDTEPKAGRVTPAHPAAGTDRSTGRGMPRAETPVPRSAWLTAAIGILRLGKASGRTRCPPSSAAGEPCVSSQGPALSRALVHHQPLSSGSWEKRVQGGGKDAWGSHTANIYHHPQETPRPPCSALTAPFAMALVFKALCTLQPKLGWSSAPCQDTIGYLPPMPGLLAFETGSCPKTMGFPQGP